VILPTRNRTGGIVFRVDLRNKWLLAHREAKRRGVGSLRKRTTLGTKNMRKYNFVDVFL
jgi:hypothetical protein